MGVIILAKDGVKLAGGAGDRKIFQRFNLRHLEAIVGNDCVRKRVSPVFRSLHNITKFGPGNPNIQLNPVAPVSPSHSVLLTVEIVGY